MPGIALVATSDILLSPEKISRIRDSGTPLLPVALVARLGDEEYFDVSCIDSEIKYNSISPDVFYQVMFRNNGNPSNFPTTSQPGPGQFQEAIVSALDAGADEVYVFPVLPSRSGSLNSALLAASTVSGKRLPDGGDFDKDGYYTGRRDFFNFPMKRRTITVFNTRSASAGIGYEVWSAWRERENGRESVIRSVTEAMDDIYIQACIHDPRYVAKRFPKLPAPVIARTKEAVSALDIYLPIYVERGALKPGWPVRTESRMAQGILEDLEKRAGPLEVWVLHSGGDGEGKAETMAEVIRGKGHNASVSYLPSPIGAYIGPGRYGVVAYPATESFA
jgi:fatty acid-binding protein DegV